MKFFQLTLVALFSINMALACGEQCRISHPEQSCSSNKTSESCQCAEPVCFNKADRGCMSFSDCCQAYGEVGRL